jgi:LPXTG-site transpeptidase (sortase) family protein
MFLPLAVAATAVLTLGLLLAQSLPQASGVPDALIARPPVSLASGASTSPSVASTAPPRAPAAVDQLRISVPRLGIDLPMALGDIQRDVRDGATPENVALLYPTTNVPGTGGNSFIYAHARNSMFLALWDIQVGDRVRITAADGTRLNYVVTRIIPQVDPGDVSWLDPSGPERLTLQTSTGPTSAFPRFIAVADRVPQGD